MLMTNTTGVKKHVFNNNLILNLNLTRDMLSGYCSVHSGQTLTKPTRPRFELELELDFELELDAEHAVRSRLCDLQ